MAAALDWWLLGSLLLSVRPLEGAAGAVVWGPLALWSAQQLWGPGVHFSPVRSCAAAVIVPPKNCELQENKVPAVLQAGRRTCHKAGLECL